MNLDVLCRIPRLVPLHLNVATKPRLWFAMGAGGIDCSDKLDHRSSVIKAFVPKCLNTTPAPWFLNRRRLSALSILHPPTRVCHTPSALDPCLSWSAKERVITAPQNGLVMQALSTQRALAGRSLPGILVALVAGVCCGADTLSLKDGQTIKGTIMNFENGTFMIDEGKETAREIAVSEVLKVEFDRRPKAATLKAKQPNDEIGAKPSGTDQRKATIQAAAQPLEGDELDGWKLARSHIATNHDIWMPDNAMPIRDAIKVTPTGDYLVAIPVVERADPGFAPNYGIFYVQVTKFGTTLRVDGDTFQKTNGPFRPKQPRQPRGLK